MNTSAPEHFWEPIRQRLVRNLGRAPSASTAVQEGSAVQPSLPLVLYISRQAGRRSLSNSAHTDLVRALKKLEEEGICQVHISRMESLTFQEQVELVAKATVSRWPLRELALMNTVLL
jgi:protein O-GlcNAc transferase